MAPSGSGRVRALGVRAWARGASRWLARFGQGALLALVIPAAMAQVAVTDSGTASYSFPIGVPPGIGGMAPIIALNYGGGSNGPVGYGWGIQGISTITRCPQIRAIDGFTRGVTFTKDDKLCLDGQRLIQTNESGDPTAAANGLGVAVATQANDSQGLTAGYREYRTEKDSFARIRAYGNAGGAAANGPAYFKVWTKSGQIYEYGAGPSADANTNALVAAQGKSAAMVWAASRISDTLGSYIDFKYIQRDTAWGTGPAAGPQLGREWNLVEIQYTGNGAQAPANKVVFDYADRPNTAGSPQGRAEAYQAGSKNVSIWRLQGIRTYVNWGGPALGVVPQGTTFPAVPVSPTNAGNVITPAAGAVRVKTVKVTYATSANTGRSLVSGIKECVGANEDRCSPAPSFQYSTGGAQTFQPNAFFAASTLSTSTRMIDAITGNFGVVLGDFNGDGKTDILRWGNAPSDNQMLLSNGDGTFAPAPLAISGTSVNVNTEKLFSNDGCYSSIVADFNSDGVTDILRTVALNNNSGGACTAAPNQLYLGRGDGSFKPPLPLTGIDLSVVKEKGSAILTNCTLALIPLRDGDQLALAAVRQSREPLLALVDGSPCRKVSKTTGKAFHLIDVNGDGIVDIVTTINPGYANVVDTDPPPTPDQQCASITCTRVYLGSVSGTFAEQTTTNLVHHSVYSDAPLTGQYAVLVRPNTVDVDGDGLTDLVVNTGTWLSAGNGNFALGMSYAGTPPCANPMDVNGDGRLDCVSPAVLSGQIASLQMNTGAAPVSTANFNLTGTGQELYAWNANTLQQSIGMLIADFIGDGRTGILRWEDAATSNVLYLSNGDGTFRTSTSFNLSATNQLLRNSDGRTSYLAGDFTGKGGIEILRMKHTLTAGSEGTTNQLYERVDKTPPDQLIAVTSPSGLKTTLTWVPLSNPYYAGAGGALGGYPRYTLDRSTPAASNPNAAAFPQVDLVMPMYVVATTVADTGVGSNTVAAEYAYAGLKADVNRGLLGFREVRRQSTSANGANLTLVTQALQTSPYIGATRKSQTFNGDLWSVSNAANAISTSTYTYCDKTSAAGSEAGASPAVPCATTAKVQKPYQLSSIETGTDLAGYTLPTVTTINAFDLMGNLTSIAVTTAGAPVGTSLPATSPFTKTTTNTYLPDNIAGDTWVLGRLAQATQKNVVPNALAGIGTSAGSAPSAAATQGTGTPPPISPAVLAAILQLLLED